MPRLRPLIRIVPRSLLVLAMAALAWSPPRALAQAARSKDADPARSLARYVPAKDLIAYVEFDGFDNHARAWRGSAMYKVLNQTKLGALLEDLAAQGIEAARKSGGAVAVAGGPTSVQIVSALERMARSGFVLAINGKEPKTHPFFAFRAGARPELRTILEGLAGSMATPGTKRTTLEKARRKVLQFGEGEHAVALWNEGGDALLCEASNLDSVLSFLDGKRDDNALSSPVRTQVARGEAGLERIALGFLDMSAVPPPPPDMARLGVGELKRIDFQWGFQADAMLGVLRLVAPSPRSGVFALFDQPTFEKSALPPLPAGLPAFTALSIDPGKTYDQVIALNKASDPGAAQRIAAMEANLRQTLGLDLRKDVLAHLGPQWTFYNQPGAPAGGALGTFSNLTLTVQVRDPKAIGKALEQIVPIINQQLAAPRPGGRQGPVPQLQKIDGPDPTYALSFPPGPTLILGKDRLVIAGRRQAAEAALAVPAGGSGGRWAATGAYIPVMRQIPPRLVILSLSDPRETFPALIENLPALLEAGKAAVARGPGAGGGGELPIRIKPAQVPRAADLSPLLFPSSVAVTADREGIRLVTRDAFPSISSPANSGVLMALLLPAVQSAREAARRSQCVNNLKQIGLALHNHISVHDALPKAAITDAAGRPLLSWRVAILPYLDQESLYKKFKLDEPWDSPHNRELIAEMPKVYACPSTPRPATGATPYRVFSGPLALLDPKVGVTLRDITDGTSSTLAVVESKETVPWTKPDELPFDPKLLFPGKNPTPLFGAGSFHPGGFNALFADGSVRFIKLSIAPQVLGALITRAGGEVVEADAF